MTDKINLGFIGAGALATTLSVAFEQQGFKIAAVSSRRFESAKSGKSD